MIKNVFIFTLLQIYVREKNMICERGEWGDGKNMIFNVIYRPLFYAELSSLLSLHLSTLLPSTTLPTVAPHSSSKY